MMERCDGKMGDGGEVDVEVDVDRRTMAVPLTPPHVTWIQNGNGKE